MSTAATQVVHIPGEEFVRDYLDVRPGEHISLIGPNGTGKTTLGMRILPVILAQNPKLRAVVLAMKPHKKGRRTGDETLARYAKAQGARVIRTWPAHRFFPKQRIFVLWPVHKFDDYDEDRHAEIFADALYATYKNGDWIIFGDETYSLTHEMGLSKPLIRIWTKGRSMETSMIGATQKPSHVPLWFYSQAQHLFLWHDPDAQARKRYAEIGGFDPKLITRTLFELDRHSCLYLRSADRTMCIVDAD